MAIAPHTERRPPAEVTCHLATAEVCSRLASQLSLQNTSSLLAEIGRPGELALAGFDALGLKDASE